MGREASACRLTFANHNVAGVLGDVLSVFTQHNVNVIDMVNKSRGDIAYNIIDLETVPDSAVIAAIEALEHVSSLRVIDV